MMKHRVLILIFTICFPALVLAETQTRLSGDWVLSSMIYRGEEIPPMNPNLNLRWSFYANGTDRLYWDRKGESGFCERFANYEIANGQIFERVFAVNPLNSLECAQDPDMQLGRQTASRIEIQKTQILLHLQLGDEDLIYVLKEAL